MQLSEGTPTEAVGQTPNHAPPAYFEAVRSAEIVNARMGDGADPRIKTVMAVLVRHLHAAVKEAALTHEEWAAAIAFLTSTGQTCTDWRQEFILLSDVLGVSMLVDSLNHQRPAAATENTVLGPFHLTGAPAYDAGADINLGGKGEPVLVRGRVTDLEGRPVVGAKLDVWQASDDGFYDVQQPDVQPVWNLRGVFETDDHGRYWFRSAKPRWYPIPHDGPVGELLEKLDRQPNRAAHLHFIVTAPDFDAVTTHIFTPDCPFLNDDAVFGVKESLIADFRQVESSARATEYNMQSPFWEVEWDFVLSPSRAAGRSGR